MTIVPIKKVFGDVIVMNFLLPESAPGEGRLEFSLKPQTWKLARFTLSKGNVKVWTDRLLNSYNLALAYTYHLIKI